MYVHCTVSGSLKLIRYFEKLKLFLGILLRTRRIFAPFPCSVMGVLRQAARNIDTYVGIHRYLQNYAYELSGRCDPTEPHSIPGI